MPCIYVLNKIDAITIEELDLVSQIPHHVPVSANHLWNFDELLEKIWQYLGLIRVYTKPKGQIPDYEAPVVMKGVEPTVANFCNRLHKHILENFK
jgi:ribosome-interacting GTPase 1